MVSLAPATGGSLAVTTVTDAACGARDRPDRPAYAIPPAAATRTKVSARRVLGALSIAPTYFMLGYGPQANSNRWNPIRLRQRRTPRPERIRACVYQMHPRCHGVGSSKRHLRLRDSGEAGGSAAGGRTMRDSGMALWRAAGGALE